MPDDAERDTVADAEKDTDEHQLGTNRYEQPENRNNRRVCMGRWQDASGKI